MIDRFDENLSAHIKVVSSLKNLKPVIHNAAESMIEAVERGGTIFWAGNGGSAADAQHYAAELMVRYVKNRPPIASVALTTDTSLLTAHSNDFEYESVFERQVEGLVKNRDVFVGISTSGNSKNIALAMAKANEVGATTVGMLGGDGGIIGKSCKHPIIVPNKVTARIQEAHLVIGHYLCELLEEEFSSRT